MLHRTRLGEGEVLSLCRGFARQCPEVRVSKALGRISIMVQNAAGSGQDVLLAARAVLRSVDSVAWDGACIGFVNSRLNRIREIAVETGPVYSTLW
jgi:hypothetical protein